jgi:hypothetical protein
LLTGKDIPLPEPLHAHRQPFKWNVAVQNNKLGVIPDGAFVLEFPDPPIGRHRVLYFIEADCGTMPVTRGTLMQSSFHRKLLAYEATWQQGVHRRRFGFNRFRVLTITTNAQRVNSLVEACAQLEHARGLFLFADHAALARHANILSLPFQTGHAGGTEVLLAN